MANNFADNISKMVPTLQNGSGMDYSILKEYYSPNPFRKFSIKYVVDGTELYAVNGKKYRVKNKQYLLANRFSEGFVEVDSKTFVKGICIDIAPEILSEVVSAYLRADTANSDLSLDTFFNSGDFHENKYSASDTHLGRFLIKLETLLESSPDPDLDFTKDFYYRLSEEIVVDHIPIYRDLQSVKAIRNETKKDLLRKLQNGKELIDADFLSGHNTEFIALQSGISEYHFYRLFKSVFKITPHQYLIQKRLEHAAEMLRQGERSITTVAFASGFPDVFSFSKSFKKRFGYSPSGRQKHTD